MELTISLLFFAFAAAVCIQLFVKAHNLNEESKALNDAHMIATQIAECYRAGEIESMIPDMIGDDGMYRGGSYVLYYDANADKAAQAVPEGYTAELLYAEGNLDIKVGDYYSLSVYRYIPGKTDEAGKEVAE